MNELANEILLSFWKVHILHHAEKEPIYGLWIMEELRRHGYAISPGTLYPILTRMERHGWLAVVPDPKRGPRGRKNYRLTRIGGKILKSVREQTAELYREVVLSSKEKRQ